MALDGIYYPHALYSTASGIPYITPFSSVDVNFNYDMVESHSNADPYPCFVGVMASDPQIDFTTTSIANALAVVANDANSQNIVYDATGDATFALYYAKGKPQGFRYATAAFQHIKALMNTSAMMYWTSISARQDELATISVSINMIKPSASIDPLVFSGRESLNGVASACQNLYTLGPIYWTSYPGGVTTRIESITDMQWNNNIRRYSRRTGGEIVPTWQSIAFHEPMVTVTTNDLENVISTPGLPLAPNLNAVNQTFGGDQGQLTVYLRRKQATGGLVSEGANEHIQIQAASSATLKKVPNVSGTDPAEARIEFSLAGTAGFDNPMTTISLTATIPDA